jgi:hypothetical protein
MAGWHRTGNSARMTNTADTQILAEAIERKHALLVRLLELGARQSQLIDQGSLTDLLKLLTVKQGLIHELQLVERQMDPFRGQDPLERRWSDPRSRQQCAEKLADCEKFLAEILRQEKSGETLLRARRDEAASRLAGAHWAREAQGAYHEQTPPRHNQLDLSSGA